MKVLGLLFVIAIVVIGYCVYPIVVDSAEFTNTRTGKSASDGCKGPFGFDSQKVFDASGKRLVVTYMIGVVFEQGIDLEKNDDGTWYVNKCQLSNFQNLMDLSYSYLLFTSPYPQQNDLKAGDIIGFSSLINRSREGIFYYTKGKVLDRISAQAANCKMDAIDGLSTPVRYGKRFGSVTGVIIAVQIGRNHDPEPDNPDDFQIEKVVMKCADGNLYIVKLKDKSDYQSYEKIESARPVSDPNRGRYRILMGVNLPSHEAFGEGDIVTLEQLQSVTGNLQNPSIINPNYLSFNACYKKDVK